MTDEETDEEQYREARDRVPRMELEVEAAKEEMYERGRQLEKAKRHLQLKKNALRFWTERRTQYAARLLLNRNLNRGGDAMYSEDN